MKFKPWFWGTGIDDAVTTAAWTDEEAEALAIQPAKAFAFAAAAVGGKGCAQENWKKKGIIQCLLYPQSC